MEKTFFTILFLVLFTLLNVSAQSITWQALYNGPNSRDDEAYAICNADSNNFFIAGYTWFPTGAALRCYVIKINPFGDTLWTRVVLINGGGGIVNALLPTADGGCVATGEKFNAKFLFRLDKNGNTVWTYSYGGNVIFYDLKRAANGDYICTGLYQNGGGCLRIDTLGNVKYDRLYLNHFFQIKSLQATPDNGCVVAGYSLPNQAIIVKLDSAGNVLNFKSFNVNNQPTISFSLEKDNSNNYILTGNYSNGTKDIPYFIKLDNNLNPLDTHIFSQIGRELAHAMRVLPTGNYVWSFWYYGFNRLLITDFSGNIIHEKIKNTTASEEFYDIHPVDNGDIIFIGYAEYSGTNTWDDMFVIRTDSLLNFPPNIIGIQQTSSTKPENFKLYQNYPNPFNPVTTIKYDIPKDGNVSIKIYDITGGEVFGINEYKQAGSYEIRFDGTNFASGIYLYRIESGDYMETKKLILVK